MPKPRAMSAAPEVELKALALGRAHHNRSNRTTRNGSRSERFIQQPCGDSPQPRRGGRRTAHLGEDPLPDELERYGASKAQGRTALSIRRRGPPSLAYGPGVIMIGLTSSQGPGHASGRQWRTCTCRAQVVGACSDVLMRRVQRIAWWVRWPWRGPPPPHRPTTHRRQPWCATTAEDTKCRSSL